MVQDSERIAIDFAFKVLKIIGNKDAGNRKWIGRKQECNRIKMAGQDRL